MEIPFLLWVQGPQRAAAYMPGTVNLLLYNRTAIVARPSRTAQRSDARRRR